MELDDAKQRVIDVQERVKKQQARVDVLDDTAQKELNPELKKLAELQLEKAELKLEKTKLELEKAELKLKPDGPAKDSEKARLDEREAKLLDLQRAVISSGTPAACVVVFSPSTFCLILRSHPHRTHHDRCVYRLSKTSVTFTTLVCELTA